MKLRLPQGYYLEKDPDIWMLRRPDGRSVAAFSARGVVAETIESAAWEDHRPERAATESVKTPPGPRPLGVALPRRLAHPDERRRDPDPEVAPLPIDGCVSFGAGVAI